jgi:hypothetical protein
MIFTSSPFRRVTIGRGVPAGRHHPVPGRHLEVLEPGFGDGRHLGQRGRALRRDQRERAQLARLDVRQGGRNADEHQLDFPGEDPLHREVHAL